MSRNGKIARCPGGIRHYLNTRLENGEEGETLLAWLNGVDEVREMLDQSFAGVPISKQNLSEWRQGGYQEWLAHQQTLRFVREVAGQGSDIDAAGRGIKLSEWLANHLGVEFARVSLKILAETADTEERWQSLQELLPQLAKLRRYDQRAVRLHREQELWERDDEERREQEEKNAIRAEKHKILAPLWEKLTRKPLADICGGGKAGDLVARYIHAVNQDLPLPSIEEFQALREEQAKTAQTVPTPARPVKPGPTWSNPVKPSQT